MRTPGPARIAIVASLAYVAFNLGLSRAVATQVLGDAPYPQVAVASPVPLAFWRREVLWRNSDGTHGTIPCTLLDCQRYPLEVRRARLDDPLLAARAKDDPATRAFLFWSRMPLVEHRDGRAVLMDQRYMDRAGPSFSVDLGPVQ